MEKDKNIGLSEVTDAIYDTLMNNSEPSELYKNFNSFEIDKQEVHASHGFMWFEIGGKRVHVQVSIGDIE